MKEVLDEQKSLARYILNLDLGEESPTKLRPIPEKEKKEEKGDSFFTLEKEFDISM